MAGSGKLVTVFGGSGFLGRYIVRELAERGYRVRAAVRRPDLAGHLQPMGVVGQIHAVQANVRFPESVARAIDGADAVVNAVGILSPVGAQSFDAVHVKGAQSIAQSIRENGRRPFVHISAIGADKAVKSNYAKSKSEAEKAVLSAKVGSRILRPSIVFGPEDEFFNRFAAMARLSPVLPLIGGGRTKFQPVYVGDIANAVANAIEEQGSPETVYELGGPNILSFRELLDLTQEYSGRKRAYLPMPFWLAKLQALLTWPLPQSLRPITVDQVRLLEVDNVVSEQAQKEHRDFAALGVSSASAVASIVPTYLERFKPHGQYAHYRP